MLFNILFVLISSLLKNGQVDLQAFLSAMNWKENAIANPRSEEEMIRLDDKKMFETTTLERQRIFVNYSALMADLNGN